jgi:HD-GYP domain-containing protein (c-di-GMP phosphodiesterase class II)/DNA-binding CsgD family transcriptional regulator
VVRLAEIVGTLSIAADASAGMPESHALRGAIVAASFAMRLGLGTEVARDAFYLPLLAMAGCSADAHAAASVVFDEVRFGEEIYGRDVGRIQDVLPVLMRMAARGKGPLDALISWARAVGKVGQMTEVSRAHCEVAIHLAGRLGFDEAFRGALFGVFERWDGSGVPDRTPGERLPLALRVAQVAVDANVGHRLGGGVSGAVALVKKRAGLGLDPELVERFERVAVDACSGLDRPSPWLTALDAEPLPHRTLDDAGLEESLLAVAHFTDLKSRFTQGHSTGVSALAASAGRVLGFDAGSERIVRRAGLVHDIGRVAVTAAIWDKPGPLTDSERERVRLHTYVGERVLSRASSLAAVAEVATLAHERLDESGYHRRLSGSVLSVAARVLAAADVYHAVRELRPHRPALDAERAAEVLTRTAHEGRLCPDAVRAVLAGASGAVPTVPRPGGLTDREVQVLQLVARGLTNKEIAVELDISIKTAGHHVQHVLEKLGVRTRAAATMVAMQRGLVIRA